MRFHRLRIDAYGALRELDTGPDPLPGLVAVHGPNEAGKSTFFDFLGTLLYGFYPASRDRNPYAPWSGGDAEGSARIRLADGRCMEVRRRLLSSPAGTLTLPEGEEEDLRNRSLPWTTHVPRSVYGQVFALTLEELAALDEDTWGRVEDRLLGSMGSDLVPAREVAAELEEEAGVLWRPSRRGNQTVRELREELRELRGRRRDAMERDRDLRELVRRRDEAAEELEEARREREEIRLQVERVEVLAPIRRRLARIAELEEAAGSVEELDALPADPGTERDRLRATVEGHRDRLTELEARTEEPRAALEALGDVHRRLLERRDAVARFTARAAGWASDRARLDALRQDLRDRERRLDSVAEHTLAVPWRDAPRGPLLALPAGELRQAGRAFEAARDRLSEARERASASAPATPDATDGGAPDVEGGPGGGRALLGTGLAALLAGGVGLGMAGLQSSWVAALPALLALVAGGVVLKLWADLRAATTSSDPLPDPTEERALEVERLEARVASARSELEELVRDVPVEGARLREAPVEVAGALERIQELLQDREERARRGRELEEGLAAADREATELAGLLQHDPELGAEALARLLERELHRAERLRDAAESGGRELERIRDEAMGVREERDRSARRLKELEELLREQGDGDGDRGVARIRRRLEARESARSLRQELERAHPELEERVERIRRAEAHGESWTRDDDALVAARSREDALTRTIEELTRTSERLDQELRRGMEKETVDAVDSEIATLEAEVSRLLDERDRRWILAHLVREADRAFREEHQPDLLRRAGRYLSTVTGGRYRRLVADDGSAEHRFHLVGGDRDDHTPLAPPLSTGTLEQAYLSLRLAIVDHLDEGQERLPLLVDEALVNWDARRRARGWDLLQEVAERRQVFVFTCHAPMVEELARRGARTLELAGSTDLGT